MFVFASMWIALIFGLSILGLMGLGMLIIYLVNRRTK